MKLNNFFHVQKKKGGENLIVCACAQSNYSCASVTSELRQMKLGVTTKQYVNSHVTCTLRRMSHDLYRVM